MALILSGNPQFLEGPVHPSFLHQIRIERKGAEDAGMKRSVSMVTLQPPSPEPCGRIADARLDPQHPVNRIEKRTSVDWRKSCWHFPAMKEAQHRRVILKMLAGSVLVNPADAWQEKAPRGISDILDGTAMIRIPEGEFEMGSANGNADESPVHRVRITRAFEVGRYEVTQAQCEGVMREAHMKADVRTNFSHFQGPNLPVESVTWDEAQAFLKRLNDRDRGHIYRLPTEAEWEYACGRTAAASLEEVAWFGANSEKQTQPVGTKRPDSRGMFDMLGNVAEWVQDWYERDYYAQSPPTDPRGPDTGSYRVYRGGCWFDAAKNCRSAYRGFDFPSNRVYNVGFRVVRTSRP